MVSKNDIADKRVKLTKEIMEYSMQYANPKKWFKAGKLVKVHNRMQKNYSYVLSFNPGTNLTCGSNVFDNEIFYPNFKPAYSPEKMLQMGIMGGKYCNDQILEFPKEWYKKINKFSPEYNDKKLNYFKVNSRQSLQTWRDNGWIPCTLNDNDNRGWFEWYCRYWLGRRQPDVDIIQIKRWMSFKRHYSQFLKQTKGNGNDKHPRRRQALLQWSYPCLD